MRTPRSEDCEHALSSLCFFGLPAARQIESWRRTHNSFPVPKFFRDNDIEVGAADYFFGVACVFTTYKSVIYDEISSENYELMEDFTHRLGWMMHAGRSIEWSAEAVLSDVAWERLRADAIKLAELLGSSMPADTPIFDVSALVDPDEFITSDEARKLLG